jgi:hypothetical protein
MELVDFGQEISDREDWSKRTEESEDNVEVSAAPRPDFTPQGAAHEPRLARIPFC